MKKSILLLIVLIPFAGFGQNFQSDLAAMVQANSEKVIGLANAIPEDHYDWAPAEGVRDVKGVIFHIAGANYFFPSLVGVDMPAGINPRDMASQIQGKEATIEALRKSYDHMINAIKSVSDEQLNETKTIFGQEMTVRAALLIAFGHCEEHMGQLIAYARSNDVAPPWSQSE